MTLILVLTLLTGALLDVNRDSHRSLFAAASCSDGVQDGTEYGIDCSWSTWTTHQYFRWSVSKTRSMNYYPGFMEVDILHFAFVHPHHLDTVVM